MYCSPSTVYLIADDGVGVSSVTVWCMVSVVMLLFIVCCCSLFCLIAKVRFIVVFTPDVCLKMMKCGMVLLFRGGVGVCGRDFRGGVFVFFCCRVGDESY